MQKRNNRTDIQPFKRKPGNQKTVKYLQTVGKKQQQPRVKTSLEIENGIRTFCSEKQKSQIIYHQQTCTNGYINDEIQAEGKYSQMAAQRCNKK